MSLDERWRKTHSKQVMVANAGILVAKSLFEVSVDEWDKVMAVCTRFLHHGPFVLNSCKGQCPRRHALLS